MANGRSDHATPPHCAMQLGSMLRREAAKDNGWESRDLLDAFPGQGCGHPLTG